MTHTPDHRPLHTMPFMAWLGCILWACLLPVNGVMAQEQPTDFQDTIVMIRGKVTSSGSILSLLQVHIINLSLNRATLSDRLGNFLIEAQEGDTLYFSHVGFKKRLVRYSSGFLDTAGIFHVLMFEDTTVLKRYRVFAATRVVQFKSDFIARKAEEDTLNTAFETFKEENYFKAPSAGLVLPGPFTLIYENFNKQARLKKKLDRNRQEYYDNLSEEEKRKVLFFEGQ
ncbi:MAG TPA: hypothetical protein P5228_10640 [Bacteroidales bacterium]|nr:hypothetical protein [Bacteroidales bacterium]